MRIFLTVLLMLFSFTFAAEVQLRDYDEFDIPAGIHLPVISLQEFSTAYTEEGDVVKFEVTSDIFLFNKKIIPEGTVIAGYIDNKHEPVKGTNASMKVFLNKMYIPDGDVVPMKGYIYTSNNNLIGGELTPPAKYDRIPQYPRWVMFRAYSVTRCVPGAERKMGEHVTISSGANLMVVLIEPIHMTHAVIEG